MQPQRDENARQRRHQKIDDHGRPDHHAELAAAEPIERDQTNDQREHEPVEQPDNRLPPDDPRGVDRAKVLRCERAYRHCHGLGPGIAAH